MPGPGATGVTGARSMADLVVLEKADGVAVITLNRPDQLNAYSVAMKDELIAAIDDVDADGAVRAAVVTGAGRAFCAGMDLSDPTRSPVPARTTPRAGGTAAASWRCACSPRRRR